MQSKPRSIELAEFSEELLPSGRKMLHCVFKEKFGTFRYKWTPPWKGDAGVERLFFKAIEVEEWNDYDGAWSKELKEASREIPSLEEFKLPVRIQLGTITEVVNDETQEQTYRLAVEVLSEEMTVLTRDATSDSFICVGDVMMSWKALKSDLFKLGYVTAASKGLQQMGGWTSVGDSTAWETSGARFHVWLKPAEEKVRYRVIGKEIAANVRSFIRQRLSDHRALGKGFEEA